MLSIVWIFFGFLFFSKLFSVVKHEVVGVIGEAVAVPCNCTPAYSHLADKPALILWYKDRSKLPIYRYRAFKWKHFPLFYI